MLLNPQSLHEPEPNLFLASMSGALEDEKARAGMRSECENRDEYRQVENVGKGSIVICGPT